MKTKLEIYALSVCFAAVVCLVISMGIAGYSIFEITEPQLTIDSYKYNKYQTNEAYWKSKASCGKEDKVEEKPGDEALTRQRIEAFSIEIKGVEREGFQALIRCFMFILVSSIALYIHWKIAKKSRET